MTRYFIVYTVQDYASPSIIPRFCVILRSGNRIVSISVVKIWPRYGRCLEWTRMIGSPICMRSQLLFVADLAPNLRLWKLSEPDEGGPAHAISSTSQCLRAFR